MSRQDWNQRYIEGDLPWDSGVPERHLVQLVEHGAVTGKRALDIGCGTGTNAVWLAQRGFEVRGLDISVRAIEQARAKCEAAGVEVELEAVDFLRDPVAGGPYDLIFDRGVFHVFDDPEDRHRFARRVAELLHPQGRWLSLIGSTEGPERDSGPPRRSARDVTASIEPVLELVSLTSTEFFPESEIKAWRMLAGHRAFPAQPSTRR